MTDLPRRDQDEHVYYVYAVVRSHDPRQPADLPAEGILPGFPVRAVAHGDLLAVMSPVPRDDFGEQALPARLQDAGWTCDRVLAHQRVLAHLMAGYTQAPFTFCTLYTSVERIREMLARHYLELDQTLRRLQGATEWGVKLYCDRGALSSWVQQSSPELQPLRESLAGASGGASFFHKKKLEQAVGRVAEAVADGCVDESHRRLAVHARGAVTGRLQEPGVHGRPAEMILNGAYLVAGSVYTDFRAELDSLAAAYGGQGFTYELTGPWPPYNFAALELNEVHHERAPLER